MKRRSREREATWERARSLGDATKLRRADWELFVERVRKRLKSYPEETHMEIARAYAEHSGKVKRAMAQINGGKHG